MPKLEERQPPQGFFRGYANTKWYKASGEFREPQDGEYYLSGAIVAAYRAGGRVGGDFWIAVEVKMATCSQCGGRGYMEAR